MIKKLLGASSLIVALTLVSSPANAGNKPFEYSDDGPGLIDSLLPGESTGPGTPLAGTLGTSPSFGVKFAGISQLDVRALHGNLSSIPPDTMGAVGTTQYFETSNGAYAVFDKITGARNIIADGTFWTNAGRDPVPGAGTFANGDARVLFDKQSSKWVVIAFGADVSQIQIAVSDTDDALGTWKSTIFTGFEDGFGTGTADYPTLAIDSKAIYIGTNNFSDTADPATCGYGFCGTTLNVIGRNDIFGAGGPNTNSLAQFYTPLADANGDFVYPDNGFAIQGVNQVGSGDSGKVAAVGLLNYGLLTYSVNNPGTVGATTTNAVLLDTTPYALNAKGAQPDGTRNIDTSDDRVSSAVFEVGGKIYAIHTITLTGQTHTSLELYVIDAATNTVVQKQIIGDGVSDYYQGTLSVNSSGQVVVSYNMSGFAVGQNIGIYVQSFNPVKNGNGAIAAISGPELVYLSPIDNYHNGSFAGQAAVGRQRWGDYAQVTVDPTDSHKFWLIGEYALGYLPSPTASFSRWGTYIASYAIGSVPEPGTWAMLIAGFGLTGTAMRRRRAVATA